MISASVDLRNGLQPVRYQGRRMSCLAFATSTAHEFYIGASYYLSVEYLYFHTVARMPKANPDNGTSFDANAAALNSDGQPDEVSWPYQTTQQYRPNWCPPKIASQVYTAKMTATLSSFNAVCAELDGGSPVVLGLVITDAFYKPNSDGVVTDRNPDTERTGHAVLAVGYGTAAQGKKYLLIRNSWGTSYGNAGYAWLSESYLAKQLHEAARVG